MFVLPPTFILLLMTIFLHVHSFQLQKRKKHKNKQQEKLSSFRRTMHTLMSVHSKMKYCLYDKKNEEKERQRKMSNI